jgi:hypothetical protein
MELLQNWPWWIFQDLDEANLFRLMDCFHFEGHKVLKGQGRAAPGLQE